MANNNRMRSHNTARLGNEASENMGTFHLAPRLKVVIVFVFFICFPGKESRRKGVNDKI